MLRRPLIACHFWKCDPKPGPSDTQTADVLPLGVNIHRLTRSQAFLQHLDCTGETLRRCCGQRTSRQRRLQASDNTTSRTQPGDLQTPDVLCIFAQVLWAAYKQTEVRGSSTACLLKLKYDMLHGCNVGDSGFMVRL